MGTVRRVCRNVKYWRSPSMALRWVAAKTKELHSIPCGCEVDDAAERCKAH